MSDRPQPEPRSAYRHFLVVPTRWMDVDVYGHVNNVEFYSYFDTLVNRYLIEAGALEPMTSPVIGLVVETQCSYFEGLSFPQDVHAGLRVGRIGDSSVRYEIALFAGEAQRAAAQGRFIHVYVDRVTRRMRNAGRVGRTVVLRLRFGGVSAADRPLSAKAREPLRAGRATLARAGRAGRLASSRQPAPRATEVPKITDVDGREKGQMD